MRVRVPLAALAAAALLSAGITAAGPSFWTVATAADFLRGTSEGVYVSLDGTLSAGPALTNRLDSTPPQVWSLAEADDGTLYAGTGGDGRLLRVRPNGDEETLFDPDAAHIFAVATSGNRVFAATSPDGEVYEVAADGTATPFFDPEEPYVWAIAATDDGRVWVGTGNPAALYRLDASGTVEDVYHPAADHVVSLVTDDGGRIFAGTESPGRLYRLEADGRPFVLLDSGLAELRAVSVAADGTVFAAAVAGTGGSGGDETVAVTAITSPPGDDDGEGNGQASRRSVLYRIESSGQWEPIWESPDVIYDLAATADGGVLAATGSAGRLYQVNRDRQVLLYTGVDAKQITRFAVTADRSVPTSFATANPGRVIAIGPGVESPATFVSTVRDSESVATWGLIRWEASGTVALYTRSGNTARPDDSWTDWSGPYTRAAGEPIASPDARFLQWKAELTPTTAAPSRLHAVTVAYLKRNSRPAVSSVTVHPPGVVFQRPFVNEEGAIAGLDPAVADARRAPGDPGPPTPAPGRRFFQKGLQTITWASSDADDDRLLHRLEYRRDGDAEWHELRGDLPDRIYVWDTSAVTDGRYVLRVTASDSPSNAAARALDGSRESDPIVVDNTPPTIRATVTGAGAAARIDVQVEDARSPIQKLEVSRNGAAWEILYPTDGLADSPLEQYEISLDGLDPAQVVLRATDLLQNVTSRSAASQ